MGRTALALATTTLLLAALPGCGDDAGGTPASDAGVDSGQLEAGGAGGAGPDAAPDAPAPRLERFATVPGPLDGIVAWGSGADARLLVSRSVAGELAAVDSGGATGNALFLAAPRGLALRAQGDVLVCARHTTGTGIVGLFAPGTPTVAPLVNGGTSPYGTTASVAVGPDDSIVFTDLDVDTVYRVDPQGQSPVLVSSDISRPAGLAFAADGRTLYVASGDTGKLYAIPRSPAVGSFGPPAQIATGYPGVGSVHVMKNGDLVLVTRGSGVVRLPPSGGAAEVIASSSELVSPAAGAFGNDAFGTTWLYVAESDAGRISRIRFDDEPIALPVR
ncbi:MAG: SMP-30/gluconolactonase/LRE family protein [Polyangiaceae bacterium]|nr:SMP-30/gluconolactonase/LRE family protein [Polyangiaceae bacterium]